MAEACGTLAQYLPVCYERLLFSDAFFLSTERPKQYFYSLQIEIVSSLLLSMLKQMFADDRNDSVRATVIKSLALVMTIVESPTKYKEVF